MCEGVSGWDGSACGQAEETRNPAKPAPGNARKHQAGQRPGSGLELEAVCLHTASPLTSEVRSTSGTLSFRTGIIHMDDQVIRPVSDAYRMHTWNEAAERWQEETQHKKTAHEDARKLAWIGWYLGNPVLTDITSDVIRGLAKARKEEGSGPSTVNRYLALVRAILRRAAHDWSWIEKAPRIRLSPEPKRRVRWITPDQVRSLLDELPEHQRHACLLAPWVRLVVASLESKPLGR